MQITTDGKINVHKPLKGTRVTEQEYNLIKMLCGHQANYSTTQIAKFVGRSWQLVEGIRESASWREYHTANHAPRRHFKRQSKAVPRPTIESVVREVKTVEPTEPFEMLVSKKDEVDNSDVFELLDNINHRLDMMMSRLDDMIEQTNNKRKFWRS